MADGGTWLVLVRDVSSTIRVQGESHLDACLVIEVETGLIRGAAFGATEGEVLAQALTSAFNAPPGNLAPGHPDVVQCGPGFSGVVARAMQAVEGGSPRPQVVEVDPPAEAEDLFDSLIGHMAGRSQPEDLPGPDEWGMLYSQTLDFYRSA
ncbi:MAG TPA: hypothetical protein VF942_17160, partial [Acidimicrobiales bacterium]